MKSNFPEPDRSIGSSRRQQPRALLIIPYNSIGPTRDRILDTNILHRFSNAPDVDVGIKRRRGAMQRVGRPCDGVNAGRVERPSRGDQLTVDVDHDAWVPSFLKNTNLSLLHVE